MVEARHVTIWEWKSETFSFQNEFWRLWRRKIWFEPDFFLVFAFVLTLWEVLISSFEGKLSWLLNYWKILCFIIIMSMMIMLMDSYIFFGSESQNSGDFFSKRNNISFIEIWFSFLGWLDAWNNFFLIFQFETKNIYPFQIVNRLFILLKRKKNFKLEINIER